jgi:hypothetical protein
VVEAVNFFGAFVPAMPPADCFAIRPLVGDTEIDEPPREATANSDFNVVKPYGESGEI